MASVPRATYVVIGHGALSANQQNGGSYTGAGIDGSRAPGDDTEGAAAAPAIGSEGWYSDTYSAYAVHGQRRARCLFYFHLLLRIAIIALCGIALGFTWWAVRVPPSGVDGMGTNAGLLIAEGSPVYSVACPVFGGSSCTVTYVTDDRESTLQVGQYTALGCLVAAIVLSLLYRFYRRAAVFRAVARAIRRRGGPRAGREALLDGGGGVASEEALSAAVVRSRRLLRPARTMTLLDGAVSALVAVALAVFSSRINAWYAKYMTPTSSPPFPVPTVLTWSTGYSTCAAALALALLSFLLSLLTAGRLRRTLRKASAAAAAAGVVVVDARRGRQAGRGAGGVGVPTAIPVAVAVGAAPPLGYTYAQMPVQSQYQPALPGGRGPAPGGGQPYGQPYQPVYSSTTAAAAGGAATREEDPSSGY